MATMNLRPCPACARHVYETEPACPFCREPLALAPRAPVFNPPSGASRAQRYALAAAMLGQGMIGCKEEVEVPVYGAPPIDAGAHAGAGAAGVSGGLPRGGSSSDPGQGVQPVYGAPVLYDAGVPKAGEPAHAAGQGGGSAAAGSQSQAGAGGAASAKAGRSGEPVAVPLYGAPPRADR